MPHQAAAGQTKAAAKSTGRNLEPKAAHCQCCALVTDEGVDATDTAQLAIFIIDNNHHVTEEMAALVPLKDTTQCLDLYEAVKK